MPVVSLATVMASTYTQIKWYLDTFGQDRFRVWPYNDLRVEPLAMLRDVFEFLEVDDTSRTERIF